MSRTVPLALSVLALWVSVASSTTLQLLDAVSPGFDHPNLDVAQLSSDEVRLTLTLSSVELVSLRQGEESPGVARISGESVIEVRGMPDLPRMLRRVIIPDEGSVDVRVLSTDYVEFHDVDIAPSPGPPEPGETA